jgi:hypothetical protein
MGIIHFIVPVGADQQQVPHIRPSQQILQQIERCRVEPLQIVEKRRERMLRPREDADKSLSWRASSPPLSPLRIRFDEALGQRQRE